MKTTTILSASLKAKYIYCWYEDWFDSRAIKYKRQYHKFHDELINRCKLLDFYKEMEQIKKELP